MTDKYLDNPANAGLIKYLSRWSGRLDQPASGPETSHPDPYWKAGVHPDLVEHIWDILAPQLPTDCRWIFGGRPVLAHPDSGIVFVLPLGTLTYALRLPMQARAQAIQAGALLDWRFSNGERLDITDFGNEWVIRAFAWDRQEETAWLKFAYDYAAFSGV